MEQCWNIKEDLPVEVTIEKHRNGLRVIVPPMKLTYKTYEMLDHKHLHYYSEYHSRTNDTMSVHAGCYDYDDGACEFFADNIDELNKWLNYEKYKGILTIKK